MYAEVKNGAVVTFPYDYDILVQKNPSTKFAQTDLLSMYFGTEANLNGHELVRVTEADAPTFDKQTQKIVQNSTPDFVSNIWTLNWSVQSLTQTEQEAKNTSQAKSVRQTRDDKLKECDWVVIKNLETNSNIPSAWEVYRQALRDVTTQTGFPWTITWPDEPQ